MTTETMREKLVEPVPQLRRSLSARRKSEANFWSHGVSERYFAAHLQGNLSIRSIRQQDGNKVLRLALLLTLIYWVVGTCFYIFTVGWGLTDSSYFLVTSSLTIGYGDFVVKTDMQRTVTSFLLLFGIAGVGAAIGYTFSGLFGPQHLQSVVDKYRTEAYERGVDPSPEFEFELKKQRAKLECGYGLLALVILILVGMGVFSWLEGVSLSTSFYWCIVTAATVGYGDVVPTTDAGKWFTIFWAATTSFVLVYALGNLGMYPYQLRDWTNEKKVLLQYGEHISEANLRQLIQGVESILGPTSSAPEEENSKKRTGVTRTEFVLAMLVLLDRISVADYRECKMAFDKLDQEGRGVLLLRDLTTLEQRADEVRAQIAAIHEQRLLEERSRHRTRSTDIVVEGIGLGSGATVVSLGGHDPETAGHNNSNVMV